MVVQGFHVPSANYFGLMNPTPAYMAVLAETLVAALNPQLASLARSQLAARIERENSTLDRRACALGQAFRRHLYQWAANEANFSAVAMALAMRFSAVGGRRPCVLWDEDQCFTHRLRPTILLG